MFLKGNWATDTFITNYLPMMLFPVLYIGAKCWKRLPLVPYADMDFETGLQEILNISYVLPREGSCGSLSRGATAWTSLARAIGSSVLGYGWYVDCPPFTLICETNLKL